jgi:hypothetical protein
MNCKVSAKKWLQPNFKHFPGEAEENNEEPQSG